MHRTFATRRHLSSILILGATASSFAACIPFDTDEEFYPPSNGDSDIVSAAKAPPAISGGTLLVSGKTAVASDPDRDRIWVVDLENRKVSEIALNDGDEPGRVVEDSAGRAHVALRRGGDVVTLDLATAKVVNRREVCAAPRGIAYDKVSDVLHVACAGGELVTLPAVGGEPVRTLRLDSDLRDVIVDGDSLLVTRFRSAELIEVNAGGQVVQRSSPPMFTMFEQEFEPSVAWRAVGMPNGEVAMVHQRAMTTPVVIQEGGYATGGCDGSIVHSTITMFPKAGEPSVQKPAMPAIPFTILPVDVAASKDGSQLAMVAAGNDVIVKTSPSALENEAQFNGNEFGGGCASSHSTETVSGEPIAVAFTDGNDVVVQTREPASLRILGKGEPIVLPGVSVKDTGHSMFHRNPGGFSQLACASCHPEGRDDGRTWVFDPIGARRTQFISGGILETAPLHWDGDMGGLDTIMAEVFVKRMGGLVQGPRRVRAFAKWMDRLPALPRSTPADMSAVGRGETLFNDAKVACATCHAGAKHTNNETVDVGTGSKFQVPSLSNLAARAPYMHDGCAPTLQDRFSSECGGGDQHGKTSHLSSSDISDLVAYLETL